MNIYRIIDRVYAPLLMLTVFVCFLLSSSVAAAPVLSQRSVRLDSSQALANTSHTFTFSFINADFVGSLKFEYCVNDPFVGTSCTAPAGLSLSSASLFSQLGETGFVIDASSTVNSIILSRPTSIVTPGVVEYVFDGVINPNSIGMYFIRLSSYPTSDASGPYNNQGGLAFSINRPLSANAFVPPYLTFCVGITVSIDCSTVSGSYANLGELSATSPRTGTSQFAGSCNDPIGYSVSISGKTMISGNNVIPEITSPTVSIPGTSQFGINLRANSSPAIGADPAGIGTLVPTANYNTPNQFVFIDGSIIASSPLSSDFNIMTVSYLVNINSSQSPGIYNSTTTYIATAAF